MRGACTYRSSESVFSAPMINAPRGCDSKRPGSSSFLRAMTYANGSRVIVHALGGPFLSVDAGNDLDIVGRTLPDPLAFTSGCNGVILAGTGRGVFASRDDGRSWAPLGLEGRWVPAVAAPRCDEVFAVVQDAGLWTHSVFRSTRRRRQLGDRANEGLTGHPINDLTTDEEGTTYAAGSSGAFQWSNNEWQQIGPADITVTSVVAAPWGDAFAAAGWMGLFGSRASGEPWRKLLVGHDAHVSPHSRTGGGRRLCHLRHAQSRHSRSNPRRRPAIPRSRSNMALRGSELSTVHSFVSTASGGLLAGTENGIFRSVDDGETWIERSIGLTAFRIYCLAVAQMEPFTPAHGQARCFVRPTRGPVASNGGTRGGIRCTPSWP